ncbi:MAG: DoxX family protein [Candidatus Thermoplasmatota archaeon]|nr:DoxX family protein [Candidatus Thermoplasmatota archaeon]
MAKYMLVKSVLTTILGIFFINVGIAHFTDTEWFEPIVPEVLGAPTFWVLITGVFEIALGIGIVIPQTRRYSSLAMAFFLVAVYAGNLNMWVNDIPLDDRKFATIWHVMRLIGQLVMIVVALWIGEWLTKSNQQDY